MANAEACELDQRAINHLATISDDNLSEFELKHVGEASQAFHHIKKWLESCVEEMCAQRLAIQTAKTKIASAGHFQAEKAIKQEAVRTLAKYLEEWTEHRVKMRVAQAIQQLPATRDVRSSPIVLVKAPAAAAGCEKPAPLDDSRIRGIVNEQLVEILADPDDFAFGGWFMDRANANALRKQQTGIERIVWHEYFNRHGCQHCEKKRAPFEALGYCHRCYHRIKLRVGVIRKELASR